MIVFKCKCASEWGMWINYLSKNNRYDDKQPHKQFAVIADFKYSLPKRCLSVALISLDVRAIYFSCSIYQYDRCIELCLVTTNFKFPIILFYYIIGIDIRSIDIHVIDIWHKLLLHDVINVKETTYQFLCTL